jgi:Holliday junction resolvasome RuvABC ATP-dependent DNA helicase subunit
LRLSLPKFTVIGATTRLALLTSPLRDRFGLVQRMEFYSVDALNDIVVRAGRILGVQMTPEGAAKSPLGVVVRRVSSTVCFAGCVTMPKWSLMV